MGAISSAEKGVGRQIVEAVVGATPADWLLAVPMNWSRGFWEYMARDYPRKNRVRERSPCAAPLCAARPLCSRVAF